MHQNTQRPELDMRPPESDTRPLYVRRLDAERQRVTAELEALQDGLADLRRYLNSPKFREPSDRQFYVNTEDVLLRLDESLFAAAVAGSEAAPDSEEMR